jgi:predicted phosphodiesterase
MADKEPQFPDKAPTLWQRFLASPLKFFARLLLERRSQTLAPQRALGNPPLRIVCISDTHNFKVDVPAGDILIHAGDITRDGTLDELKVMISWIQSLPCTHKIVIGGNHDYVLDEKTKIDWGDIIYLKDSTYVLNVGGRTLNIYGSPKSVDCGGFPFQYARGTDVWSGVVPENTDILITHGPPSRHLDLLDGLGCEWLLKEVRRVKPAIHIFGHVHWGSGTETILFDAFEESYEHIMNGLGSWVDLFRMVQNYTAAVSQKPTLLVNAALVNGNATEVIQLAKLVQL